MKGHATCNLKRESILLGQLLILNTTLRYAELSARLEAMMSDRIAEEIEKFAREDRPREVRDRLISRRMARFWAALVAAVESLANSHSGRRLEWSVEGVSLAARETGDFFPRERVSVINNETHLFLERSSNLSAESPEKKEFERLDAELDPSNNGIFLRTETGDILHPNDAAKYLLASLLIKL